MIEIDGVFKTYRPRFLEFWKPVPVLRGFSMTANPGRITGLVGPNGAGKTTLFRALAGLEPLDDGLVQVNGINVRESPELVRGKIALLPENPALPAEETGRDVLRLFGLMQNHSKAEVDRRIRFIVEEIGLGSFVDRLCKGYSRGQAVRLSMARLHMMDAHTFVFDEPTVGLDFESAARVRGWMQKIASHGATVLIASHLMQDIQGLCDEVVGLKDGVRVPAPTLAGWQDALEAAGG
jgi:sodium transport system ATP-binding protein